MPRLVRRESFRDRLATALNPLDHFFRLCEELDSQDWDAFTQQWGQPIGLSINLIFLIARANTGSSKKAANDVFSDLDEGAGFGGWVSWLASLVVFILTIFSVLNTAYTFSSKRRYRLFEAPLDKVPSTPSAHRVPANSSPVSSPFQAMVNAVRTPLFKKAAVFSQQKRARKVPEVWELAVWNPSSLCILLFCVFSPGHVLVYDLLLPTTAYDSRPSITVAKAIFFGFLLSAQLVYLHSCYAQQCQDLAILHKAVANEYDVKFVQPALASRKRRDAGVQADRLSDSSPHRASVKRRGSEVDLYSSTTVPSRGFQIHPNPSYAPLLRQEQPESMTSSWTSAFSNVIPRSASRVSSGAGAGMSSSSFSSDPSATPSRSYIQPTSMSVSKRVSSSAAPSPYRSVNAVQSPVKREMGDGGSLGVYTHSASPLRRSRVSTSSVSKLRR